ncbi:MAG: SCP2 sterol-binding domain-containing protein [Solirubrobacteraceae bacterium]
MSNGFGGFDPQRAVDQIRRMAADAPAHLQGGFERLVRESPPERLEQLMRSPARRPVLDGIFWQMPKQVDPTAAGAQTTAIKWVVTGRPDGGSDVYQLVIENGQARTDRGETVEARLTVTLDGVEFLKLASGNSDPMQAYFTGRIQLSGDIMVAAKLAQMFRMPGAPDPGSGNGQGTGPGPA